MKTGSGDPACPGKSPLSGFDVLENGQKFIHRWPTHRRPIDLRTCPKQSLTEAARWCDEEIQSHVFTVYLPLSVKF